MRVIRFSDLSSASAIGKALRFWLQLLPAGLVVVLRRAAGSAAGGRSVPENVTHE